MKPLIILNWKMSLLFEQTVELYAKLSKIKHHYKLIVAPSTPYLAYLAQQKDHQNIACCAQNVSTCENLGAYTGEYSAQTLKSCGISYALIGHNERRSMFFETNAMVKQKLSNCADSGVKAILCVGETMEARKSANHKEYISEQLNSIPDQMQDIIIAYEPVWAVGSGVTPEVGELSEILDCIKSHEKVRGLDNKVKLVYGGSVSEANIKEILAVPGISGVLVGSAALHSDKLESILK